MIEAPVIPAATRAVSAIGLRGRAIANLTFHGVGNLGRAMDPGEDRVWACEETLREVLNAIAPLAGGCSGGPVVRITIDDGNQSDVRVVAPALAARGLVGTFFLCAGRMGVDGFLDAAGVRQLVAMGMRIGSHGMDHVSWRGLSPDRLRVEIRDAKAKLEDAAGAAVREAACPFGEYDRRALRMLADSGFERVFTSDRTGAREGQWLQARWSVRSDDTPESVLAWIRNASRRPWARTLAMAAKRWR